MPNDTYTGQPLALQTFSAESSGVEFRFRDRDMSSTFMLMLPKELETWRFSWPEKAGVLAYANSLITKRSTGVPQFIYDKPILGCC